MAYLPGTNQQVSSSQLSTDAEYEKNQAARAKAWAWLKTTMLTPLAHQANIYLGAALLGTNAVTNVHRYASALGNVVSFIGGATDLVTKFVTAGLDDFASSAVNALADELKNPNIDGIPIHADSEVEVSDAEVSKKLVIKQYAGNKLYQMDNVVPQLKTWQIKGYLMSNPYISPLESNLVIKPSLIAQRQILQYYMDARLPVLFKTHDNRFFNVLISHFDSQYTVQGLNALAVNLQLVEYKALEVETTVGPSQILELE